ncbi:MAG: hypothetical protein L0099_10825 [Acidobacteria bacterium]|nr:hypothetical protein [Acidobacteriota bacterium]
MKKLFAVLTLLALVSLSAVADHHAKKGEWTGTVSDAMCGAKADHSADCTKKCAEKGSALVFVNDPDKAVLKVSNADKLKGHEGHHVKVNGTLENNTLTITEVAMVEHKK